MIKSKSTMKREEVLCKCSEKNDTNLSEKGCTQPEERSSDEKHIKEVRERNNYTVKTFGIRKKEDGWVAVEVISTSNGRCTIKEKSYPDYRDFAIIKVKMLIDAEVIGVGGLWVNGK